MVLWLIPLKMEDECSSLESFHRRDLRMNGTERPSVWEGISHDAYYKFHYSLIFFVSLLFSSLFTLIFFGPVFLIIIPFFRSYFWSQSPLPHQQYLQKLTNVLLIIIFSPNYHYSNYHIKYLIPHINIPHSRPNL